MIYGADPIGERRPVPRRKSQIQRGNIEFSELELPVLKHFRKADYPFYNKMGKVLSERG